MREYIKSLIEHEAWIYTILRFYKEYLRHCKHSMWAEVQTKIQKLISFCCVKYFQRLKEVSKYT